MIVVDYGTGNLGSILNMLKYLSIPAEISASPEVISRASKLILPGVGAFDSGVENLYKSGLWDVLNEKVLVQKTPILGICLGMQLMTQKSEEGHRNGLSWFSAETRKFEFGVESVQRTPHMGWNNIEVSNDNPLVRDMDSGYKFYFVHSYFVKCKDMGQSLASTYYGHHFDAIIARDHIFGCQFHPEKSHKYGMQLFKNFDKV